MTTQNNNQVPNMGRGRDILGKRRRWVNAVWAILILLFLMFIIVLILALTLFKAREPRTQLLSAAVDGIAPRVTFPVIRIQLNITLDLQILVQNRNHASFRHGTGKSSLLYRGKQVGEAELYPGLIPAMGSTTLASRLTMQVDELASEVGPLVGDVMGGEVVMETRTRIPGRIQFLGIFRKHAVSISDCQLTIGIPDMSIRTQECKYKTKF